MDPSPPFILHKVIVPDYCTKKVLMFFTYFFFETITDAITNIILINPGYELSINVLKNCVLQRNRYNIEE